MTRERNKHTGFTTDLYLEYLNDKYPILYNGPLSQELEEAANKLENTWPEIESAVNLSNIIKTEEDMLRFSSLLKRPWRAPTVYADTIQNFHGEDPQRALLLLTNSSKRSYTIFGEPGVGKTSYFRAIFAKLGQYYFNAGIPFTFTLVTHDNVLTETERVLNKPRSEWRGDQTYERMVFNAIEFLGLLSAQLIINPDTYHFADLTGTSGLQGPDRGVVALRAYQAWLESTAPDTYFTDCVYPNPQIRLINMRARNDMEKLRKKNKIGEKDILRFFKKYHFIADPEMNVYDTFRSLEQYFSDNARRSDILEISRTMTLMAWEVMNTLLSSVNTPIELLTKYSKPAFLLGIKSPEERDKNSKENDRALLQQVVIAEFYEWYMHRFIQVPYGKGVVLFPQFIEEKPLMFY